MGKMKINTSFLPIKLHYFFFLAAMGPILPFLPIFGKQLGISEIAMGFINGGIPLLFLIIKPLFGFILDYFQSIRKQIFLSLLTFTCLVFIALAFIPNSTEYQTQISCDRITECVSENTRACSISCANYKTELLLDIKSYCGSNNISCNLNETCTITCQFTPAELYGGLNFWAFVILMSTGTIGYNICNSLSDAICFDILGPGNETKYGKQRVWGTIGFGITALVGSYLVNFYHTTTTSLKDYLPMFVLAFGCMGFDLICSLKLQLPKIPKSTNIIKDTTNLIKQPKVAVFIMFAVCVGICDSSVIFYLLWYLEDLAIATNQSKNIKLLEGLTVALETLCGEVIFFPLSGFIIKKLGYGHCFTMCFAIYALRLGLIAAIPTPWWILPVEIFLQGPTYALFYATIVAYASAVSPPGASATVQGIVAGMDDGFGFAVGSLTGGVIYRYFGGKKMFLIYSIFAIFCCISHAILYSVLMKKEKKAIQKMTPDEIVAINENTVEITYT